MIRQFAIAAVSFAMTTILIAATALPGAGGIA